MLACSNSGRLLSSKAVGKPLISIRSFSARVLQNFASSSCCFRCFRVSLMKSAFSTSESERKSILFGWLFCVLILRSLNGDIVCLNKSVPSRIDTYQNPICQFHSKDVLGKANNTFFRLCLFLLYRSTSSTSASARLCRNLTCSSCISPNRTTESSRHS